MDLKRTEHILLGLLAAILLLCSWPTASRGDGIPEFVGAYGRDLVWADTVRMTGDVLILTGGSLTIRPGTEVLVVPAEGTQIDPEYLSSQTELLIRGHLDIQGTADRPVRFLVEPRPEAVAEEYAWAGITLDNAPDGHITFAEIDRADTALRLVASSPLVEGNRISDCRYGIIAQQQSHPRILGNHLQDGEGGIFCWGGSNPYLKYNRIIDHDEEGIFVDAASRPVLDRNQVSGNAIGLALFPADLPFDPTEVRDNREDVRRLGRQGYGGDSP